MAWCASQLCLTLLVPSLAESGLTNPGDGSGDGPKGKLGAAYCDLELYHFACATGSGQVGPHAHVRHDGFPAGQIEFGGISFLVAAAAINSVQLGP